MSIVILNAPFISNIFHKWSPFINSRCRYMAEILPIRCKTLYNQLIIHIKNIRIAIVNTHLPGSVQDMNGDGLPIQSTMLCVYRLY